MFGRKKRENKNQEKVFVDGQEVPQKVPGLDLPNPYGEPVVEPQPIQLPEGACPICIWFGYYADGNGVWHHCPRCNPLEFDLANGMKKETPAKKPKPLYEFKECVHCNAKNEVHKKKKEFKCQNCGEVSI